MEERKNNKELFGKGLVKCLTMALLLLSSGGCASRRSLHTREYAQAADSLVLRDEVKTFESIRDSNEWEEEITETVSWHFSYPAYPSLKTLSTANDSTRLLDCYDSNGSALASNNSLALFEALYPQEVLDGKKATRGLPPHGRMSIRRRRLVRHAGGSQYEKEGDSTFQSLRTRVDRLDTKREESSKHFCRWPFSLLALTLSLLSGTLVIYYFFRHFTRLKFW